MSITSAKSGATGISLALDNNYMEPIASTLVGSGGVNTVIFNDIPQNYKHLQLRISGNTSAGSANLKFNSDSGINYSRHYLEGNGSTVVSGASIGYANMDIVTAPNNSNIYGANVIDILDYANNAKYKTVRNLSGFDTNGGGYLTYFSGLWLNTAAINSITINPYSGTITQYSRFSLYGIKG